MKILGLSLAITQQNPVTLGGTSVSKEPVNDENHTTTYRDNFSVIVTDETKNSIFSDCLVSVPYSECKIDCTQSTGAGAFFIAKKSYGEALVDKLRGSATVKMSASEAMKLLRGEED